jgi:uncharacterized protein (TIGR02996 family)
MRGEEGFLNDIVERPDDDVPRLVYADWLDEHGESARAELIRAQVEEARLPEGEGRAADLRVRAEELLAEHERVWLGEWADALVRWTFRRGFLESAEIEPGPFLEHGEELLARHPVRKVRFVSADGDGAGADAVPPLVACPHLARVRALDLSDGYDSGPVWGRALAKATHLTRLEELNLSNQNPGGAGFIDLGGLEALTSAAHLDRLKLLDLGSWEGEPLGDAAVGSLAQSPFAARLTTLVLDGNDLTDAGLLRLAGDGAFGRLEKLGLAGCEEATPEEAQALLGSPFLTRLTDLTLGGAVDLRALARSPRLGQLTRLALETNIRGDRVRTFTPEDWRALAASPYLGSLRDLRLRYKILPPESATHLLHSPGLAGLRELGIQGGRLSGDWFARAVADSPSLTGLTGLELFGCDLTPAGAAVLASWPGLAGLTSLELTGNFLGGEGLRALLNSPHLGTRLTRLGLGSCDLREDAFLDLASCPRLRTLTSLTLGYNNLTGVAMQALVASPYLQRLTSLYLGSEFHPEPLHVLADSAGLPRLREVVVGGDCNAAAVAALRRRFGPRLRVVPDR